MIINRIWAMPNKWTFQIKPIKDLLDKYVGDGKGWIDPFAGMNSLAEITNDLNLEMPTKYHLDAIDFCQLDIINNLKGVLWDPPYSLRQLKECYENIGRKGDAEWTKDFSFSKIKDVLSPKVRIGGTVICCGWNSSGFGKNRGFSMIEILLVCCGGAHNDYIITVEQKTHQELSFNLTKTF